jgi:hypothetical protein
MRSFWRRTIIPNDQTDDDSQRHDFFDTGSTRVLRDFHMTGGSYLAYRVHYLLLDIYRIGASSVIVRLRSL